MVRSTRRSGTTSSSACRSTAAPGPRSSRSSRSAWPARPGSTSSTAARRSRCPATAAGASSTCTRAPSTASPSTSACRTTWPTTPKAPLACSRYDGSEWTDITLRNDFLHGEVCAEPEDFGLFALAHGSEVAPLATIFDGPELPVRGRHGDVRLRGGRPRRDAAVLARRPAVHALRVADEVHAPRDRRPQVRGPGVQPDRRLHPDAAHALRVGGRARPRHDAARHADPQGPAERLSERDRAARVHRHRRPDDRPRARVRVPARRHPHRRLRLDPEPRRACRPCPTSSSSKRARTAATRCRSARSTRWATSIRRRRPERGRTSTSTRPTRRSTSGPRRRPRGPSRSSSSPARTSTGTCCSTSNARSTARTSSRAPRRTWSRASSLGPHVFQVRSVSPSGVVDSTPEWYEWLIIPPLDTDPPDTFIVDAPAISGPDVLIGLQSDEMLVEEFECSLDGAQFEGCESLVEIDGPDVRPAHARGARDRLLHECRPDARGPHLDRRRRARDDHHLRRPTSRREQERDDRRSSPTRRT